MTTNLSRHYSYGRLLRFTLPTIFVMVFTSIYTVVDGFFLSNFAGKIPFAAANFIMPFAMILNSLGYMMGTGSSALIGRTLGEGNPDKARSQFTGLFVTSIIIGVIAGIGGILLLNPVLSWMGCTPIMRPYSYEYGLVLLCFLPMAMIQMYIQPIFVTAGRPGAGFAVSVAGGLLNMVLDALFIGLYDWGVAGAALATGLGQSFAAVLSIICLLPKKKTQQEESLWFGRLKISAREALQAVSNGISEFLSNAASSLISVFYNFQLLRFAGEEGVAAYGTLMYVSMISMAVSIGYSMGSSPLVSYQFGADNRKELASLTRKSIVIILTGSVAMFLLAEALADPLAHLFAGCDPKLMKLTVQAFRTCSPVFLFSGFAIFGSGFFTALNNGRVSALIALIRTLVFQVGFILVFPMISGVDGIWFSMVAAEAMAVLVSILLLFLYRKKYGYFGSGRQNEEAEKKLAALESRACPESGVYIVIQ